VEGFPLCGGTFIITDAAMSSSPKYVNLNSWITMQVFLLSFTKHACDCDYGRGNRDLDTNKQNKKFHLIYY
jgi:hypothetical protein